MTTLVGCARKLARAQLHFDELQQRRERFIKEMQPYRAVIDEVREIDAENGELIFHLTHDVVQPPSDEWAPLLGDIAHNLMSCLDHLAFQLAIRNNGDPDRTATEFPIFAE